MCFCFVVTAFDIKVDHPTLIIPKSSTDEEYLALDLGVTSIYDTVKRATAQSAIDSLSIDIEDLNVKTRTGDVLTPVDLIRNTSLTFFVERKLDLETRQRAPETKVPFTD